MGFEWDTCQLPINLVDYHYRSFQKQVLPELTDREMGVIGMKSLGGDAQIVEGTGISAAVCRRYALSLPISTLAVGIESEENLNQDLEIARTFQPMNDLEKQAVLDQVEEHAGDGRYEWFKTTQYYDAKTHRLQHGFSVDA